MKKVISALTALLIILLAVTWYYRKPFIKKFGNREFVMVYHVEHRPELNAEFIVITRVKKAIIVDIISGPGLGNVVRLEGKEARNYLVDSGLEY